MEVTNPLCSKSFLPSRPRLKPHQPSLPCSASVLLCVMNEVGAVSTSSAFRLPSSLLLQEQRDDCRHSHIVGKEKTAEDMMDKTLVDDDKFAQTSFSNFDEYLKDFERQLLYGPVFWNVTHPSLVDTQPLLSPSKEIGAQVPGSNESDTEIHNELCSSRSITPWEALTLAKQAVIASKEAASLLSDTATFAGCVEESLTPRFVTEQFDINISTTEEKRTVRSNRHLERQSRMRRLPRRVGDSPHNKIPSQFPVKRVMVKNHKGINPDDPLGLFLWSPETTELLSSKEESEHFGRVQDLMRLEELKRQLHLQMGHEPTLVEWAEAVGTSCQVLQSRLHFGLQSRNKMIYANLRLVVYIAKNYQGMGIGLQDLLQEGSVGLIRSLEKFNPKFGCRFSTYAYWWIRQSIRRGIFQNSRTIRLPENVHGILKQIRNARRLCIQEGQVPTKEELAKRIGVTVEKLTSVLMLTRKPISLQQSTWMDQDTTFQEVTADPGIECPETSITKDLMRKHVRSLLSILTRKEITVITYRYGIAGGKCHSLSEIGEALGLSKERIRQLENRALDKLRKCNEKQGLDAYAYLLM